MIVVIDYGMGNIGSILNMLRKIGAEAMASSDRAIIEKADKLILPGVGSFDSGMLNLKNLDIIQVLNSLVQEKKIPLLGICLGMQLLTSRSEEGSLPGLGYIDGETVKFNFNDNIMKIPHMGWNTVAIAKNSHLFSSMHEDARFYFVHSYHLQCKDESNIIAKTSYGYEFASAVQHDNVIGVQFHPEKSHKFGIQLLKNFTTI